MRCAGHPTHNVTHFSEETTASHRWGWAAAQGLQNQLVTDTSETFQGCPWLSPEGLAAYT